MNEYNDKIAIGRKELEGEIQGKLTNYIAHIKNKINSNFGNFDTLLANEKKHLAKINEKYNVINKRLMNMEKQLS